MEGSSDSPWQESETSRGLNTSGVSDRNPRLGTYVRRIRVLDETSSQDFEFRKENERGLLGQSDHRRNQGGGGLSAFPEDEAAGVVDPFVRSMEWGDISLRQWLDKPKRSIDTFECLHIFRQIVEIVNVAHSQGIVVQNIRPSCFVMSSFNHVSFIESASCSDSGSDSYEEGLNAQDVDPKDLSSPLPHEMRQQRSNRLPMQTDVFSEASCMQPGSGYQMQATSVGGNQDNKISDRRTLEQVEERQQPFPMKQILLMEINWYTSPEELAGGPASCASDVYRLGVLFFEVCNKNDSFILAITSLKLLLFVT